MKYTLVIIVALLSISCSTAFKETDSTYFGGQIINPKSNNVLLLKDDVIIDTILLDEQNNFMKSYKKLDEGLYTFKHGIEFQYIYFKPADSILIRLNTWDFDESLVFSGNGSSKNEFLINLFLQNEKEEKAMYRYFKLNEDAFQAKIDSLTNERVRIFNEFKKNEPNLSEGFEKLTNTAIHFPLYRLKEIYPLYHKKAVKAKKFPNLTSKFYEYRNTISLNEKELVSFYPYQNYIVSHFYNLSYTQRENDSNKSNITENLLNAISKNIELEDFKNHLLKKVIVNDFLKSGSSCSINEKALTVFHNNCTNKQFLSQVNSLVSDSQKIENNKPLEDFALVSYNNEETSINKVLKNKKAVIYFWSTEFMSSEYLVKRIKYLEKKHSNVLFVGINIQSDFTDIDNEPNLKLLNAKKQFKLTKNSMAHKFLTSKYPRTIVVGSNGLVENGFAYLDSQKFESTLNKSEK